MRGRRYRSCCQTRDGEPEPRVPAALRRCSTNELEEDNGTTEHDHGDGRMMLMTHVTTEEDNGSTVKCYHRGKKYRGGTRALLRYFRIRAPSSGVGVRNVNKRTCQYSEAVKYHNKYMYLPTMHLSIV